MQTNAQYKVIKNGGNEEKIKIQHTINDNKMTTQKNNIKRMGKKTKQWRKKGSERDRERVNQIRKNKTK